MSLQEEYNKKIAPEIKKKFNLKNNFMVPRLKKVSVNVGVGKNSKDKAYLEAVVSNIARITGQKPVLTKAKKAVSGFKLREGMIVGVSVILRGKRAYDFTEKMIRIAFPRIRDFRGISEKQVDKQGNLTVGFKEHLPFPEIRADEVDNVHGLEISLSTSTDNKEASLELFRQMGFPFKEGK